MYFPFPKVKNLVLNISAFTHFLSNSAQKVNSDILTYTPVKSKPTPQFLFSALFAFRLRIYKVKTLCSIVNCVNSFSFFPLQCGYAIIPLKKKKTEFHCFCLYSIFSPTNYFLFKYIYSVHKILPCFQKPNYIKGKSMKVSPLPMPSTLLQ